LGFVVANNNLAAGASGVRAVEGGNNQLSDALAQLGLKKSSSLPSLESGASAPETTVSGPEVIARTGEKCPNGYNRSESDATQCEKKAAGGDALVNLNLQDWFVFKALPEQWRKNAQVNLWLIFVGVIFFVITTVAALYLQSAERNIRNAFDAQAFKDRDRDYNALMGMVHSDGKRTA
jgi:hypothetical protein